MGSLSALFPPLLLLNRQVHLPPLPLPSIDDDPDVLPPAEEVDDVLVEVETVAAHHQVWTSGLFMLDLLP